MREIIGWTRTRRLNGGSISLAELVSSSDFLEASDPRDKIYALLGMARGIYSTNIGPNYMNPPEKAYVEAMVELLAQSMDILSFAGTGTRSATSELLTKLPPGLPISRSLVPQNLSIGIQEALRPTTPNKRH